MPVARAGGGGAAHFAHAENDPVRIIVEPHGFLECHEGKVAYFLVFDALVVLHLIKCKVVHLLRRRLTGAVG